MRTDKVGSSLNPDREHEATGSSALTRRRFVRSGATVVATFTIGGSGLIASLAEAAAPVAEAIGDQHWAVGQSVFIDLMDFVTDPDGDALTFSLDSPLPPGVTLNGSIISGTPASDFPFTQYVVTIDDGTSDGTTPKAPDSLSVG